MKLLITFLMTSLLFSCTITKCHFGSGYHVEWKTSVSAKKSDRELIAGDSASEWISETNNSTVIKMQEPEGNPMTMTIQPEEQITAGEPELMIHAAANQDEVTNREGTVVVPENEESLAGTTQIAEEERKTEKSTWYSLGFFALAVILTATFALSGFLMTVGAGILIGAMAIGMFVSSLVAVVRIKNNPDRYKNKWLSFLLFFVSCTTLFFGLILFFYTIISESNFGLNM